MKKNKALTAIVVLATLTTSVAFAWEYYPVVKSETVKTSKGDYLCRWTDYYKPTWWGGYEQYPHHSSGMTCVPQ